MADSCERDRSIKQARVIQMRTSIVKIILMTFIPKNKHQINGIYIYAMWILYYFIDFHIPSWCL